MSEWFWDNLTWIILAPFAVRFLIKDVPKLIYIWKKTSNYGDDDPGGNDNINRKFHDYM